MPCQALSPRYAARTEVHIWPRNLRPMLLRYLNHEATPRELQEWASWVLSCAPFCVKDWQDDSVADHYEPMWQVLQELSAPWVDGEPTRERCHEHLKILKSLDSNAGPRSA